MDFKITGIHHIELTVANLEKSRKFYGKLPGFKIVAQYPNFIMFYTGSFYLGLTDHNDKQKMINKKKNSLVNLMSVWIIYLLR